jgi:hypothetical protein
MDARHATKLHEIDMKSRRPVVLRARAAAAASTMREVMALAPVREMASRAGGLQLEQLAAIVVEPSGELVTQVARRQRVEAYVRAMAMLRWHAVMREAIMKLGESPRVVVSGASGRLAASFARGFVRAA